MPLVIWHLSLSLSLHGKDENLGNYHQSNIVFVPRSWLPVRLIKLDANSTSFLLPMFCFIFFL